jgi:hypothetical protein
VILESIISGATPKIKAGGSVYLRNENEIEHDGIKLIHKLEIIQIMRTGL